MEASWRRRSATIRAAALVTVGLGIAGCDEAPLSEVPQDSARREAACIAAHQRLGADPAGCAVLEQVLLQSQASSRPHFDTLRGCEDTFGRDACDGEAGTQPRGPLWRPVLAGAARSETPPAGGTRGSDGLGNDTVIGEALPGPVVTDRNGQSWLLRAPAAPVAVPLPAEPAPSPAAYALRLAYDRQAPLYDDRASCEGDWQRCESNAAFPANRFAEGPSCEAVWTRCVEVQMPADAVATASGGSGGGAGGAGGHSAGGGGGRGFWWYGYNARWRQRYAASYAPRYDGWSWTGDRQPVAVYRTTGAGRDGMAWDGSARQLAPARQMVVASSADGASRGATVARAGFGSTGRAMSAGG